MENPSLTHLRSRALLIPVDATGRLRWQTGFNAMPAVTHFGSQLNLEDDRIVQITIDPVVPHHQGGLGSAAANGGVIAGLFDGTLGVAGGLQHPTRTCATVELSIKFMLPAVGKVLRCYGIALRRTSSLTFTMGELYADDRLCATATCIVSVTSGRGAPDAQRD